VLRAANLEGLSGSKPHGLGVLTARLEVDGEKCCFVKKRRTPAAEAAPIFRTYGMPEGMP
jgi:hypothetical protein